LPWGRLSGREFEECLFWIARGIGVQQLIWRDSTQAGPDQGRDLEGYLYEPTPEGGMRRKSWWLEAKQRSTTLERLAVKEAVVNATGRVDVLVIATTTTFTNPTRVWVEQWQQQNPRPDVRLWDQNTLEPLLAERPDALVRVFAEALTSQGKLDLVEARFWKTQGYADQPLLQQLWDERPTLKWNSQAFIAVMASEAANGSFSTHPWAVRIKGKEVLHLLKLGLHQLWGFCIRAQEVGINEHHYIKAMAYLLLVSLKTNATSEVLANIKNRWPKELQQFAMRQVVLQLLTELHDVCTSDCRRISTEPLEFRPEEMKTYWKRLTREGQTETGRHVLSIEKQDGRCNVGLSLNKKRSCPLNRDYDEDDHMDFP